MNKRAAWRDVLYLVVLATLIGGAVYKRYRPDCWGVPVSYHGDAWYELAVIKTAAAGHWRPLMWKTVPELNAPSGANWSDLPIAEDFLYFALGLAANAAGLMPAANLGVLLAHVLAALAFWFSARELRCSRPWALAIALLFSFSPYALFRGLEHLELLYFWHVPLCLLVSWWLARGHLTRRHTGIAFGVAFVTGFQSPYYTNLFVQLCGLALLIQLLRYKSLRNGAICAGVAAVALAAFTIGNIDTFTYSATHGPNTGAVVRTYTGVEVYALKPIELFLPGNLHRWFNELPLLKTYAQRAWVKGELFAPYLGVTAIAGLLWLCLETLRRRRLSLQSVQLGWIVAYSCVGGVNALVALLGVPLFRATNRYSIFIAAIALLFLAQRLSILTRRWHGVWQLALAAPLCVVALQEQTPRREGNEGCRVTREKVARDRTFVADLEKALPPGAMIFQLPVMPFPESPMIGGMHDYEHFRPYLFSRSLRFSYGNNRGRGAEAWQAELEKLAPDGAMDRLRERGFAAVMIHKAAYRDAPEFLTGWRSAPNRQVMESRDFVCFVLP